VNIERVRKPSGNTGCDRTPSRTATVAAVAYYILRGVLAVIAFFTEWVRAWRRTHPTRGSDATPLGQSAMELR
jgi:hypothetical protein